MKKLEIEIPNDKEIDWEASAKQKQIVFKDKQLTYEDVCKELFIKEYWYADHYGQILRADTIDAHICEPTNATTQHQLECILAKNKLANVARYLNGEWDYHHSSNKFIVWIDINDDNELKIASSRYLTQRATVIFKSRELVEQAIEILGKEVIKLALEPLY